MANVIIDKSEDLAVRIVNLYKLLRKNRDEQIMSKQMMRSGTSIGANIAEAHNAQSDADFISKMQIAIKECNETRYWVKLLFRTDYLCENEYKSIVADLNEVYAILTSILNTIKSRIAR